MNYSLLKILSAMSDNDNAVARVLLHNWDDFQSKRLAPEEFLKTIAQAPLFARSLGPVKPLHPQFKDCDMRIESFEISGFRGIPHAKSDDHYYGILLKHRLDKKDKNIKHSNTDPCSIIILGANGSGKTSVYSALEYLWVNNTAIAKKHKYETAENKFYRNYADQNTEFKISCRMYGGKSFSYPQDNSYKISQCVDLHNFFCSESDLSLIECQGESIIQYFNGEIGINSLVDLRNFIITNLKSQKEQLDALKASDGESSKENIKKLERSVVELSDIQKAINDEIKEIRTIFYLDTQTILSSLLEEYNDEMVSPSFQLEDSRQLFNGKLEWKGKGKKEPIEPRTYFNNFRFKLYLISIRIAIAFSIMKSKNICFPLVFDDIFDSSDFNNRLKAEPFFKNIVKLYHQLGIHTSPLQIIFFTQDEIIAESVYKGITDAIYDEDSGERIVKSDAIYCKLFSTDEVDEKDVIDLKSDEKAEDKDESLDLDNVSEAEKNAGFVCDKRPRSFYNLYDVIRSSYEI